MKKRKGALRSSDKFKEHNRFDYAVKVSGNDYGFDETRRILTLPFYMLFLFADEIAKIRTSPDTMDSVYIPDTDTAER